jgi:hypothetical protein
MNCRFCNHPLTVEFIDLVNSPASNSFLTKEQLNEPETYYPLKVYVCTNCFLIQVDEYKKSDAIFNNSYAYFSSYSSSWLAHSKDYVDAMISRWSLNHSSQVIELASNDGYLLQYFLPHNIPVLGIEPTKNTAEVAILKGIPCITEFFGTVLAKDLAQRGKKADLLIGNNVLAHVPNIVDFIAGQKIILKDTGVITMEFPHLAQLIENSQFDTIYHEHFSYLSFYFVKKLYESQGMELFDVEELKTHGGSLRIFAKHKEDKTKKTEPSVKDLLNKEKRIGIENPGYYMGFQKKAEKIKTDLLLFLVTQKQNNKTVAAYGAAAKGNTLINYCGIKKDMIKFVVDANPAKQNKFLPASHIPVYDESRLREEKPDYVIILPWNLREEIIQQLSYIREWGAKFVVPIPKLEII